MEVPSSCNAPSKEGATAKQATGFRRNADTIKQIEYRASMYVPAPDINLAYMSGFREKRI
jgi:hypothetical protein|tara:strand:+ start:445 stop:624 length:180 start_codon:yes stop_codon:yes gene_type:complete